MYFYKLIRLESAQQLEEKLVRITKGDRVLIIPVFSPSTKVGRALMDGNYFQQVSKRSEAVRLKVDIVYIKEEHHGEYEHFLDALNKWASYAVKEFLKDPVLIIILPGDWEVFLLTDLTEDDTEYLKSTLFGIIECMDSEKPSTQLHKFIRKRRISVFFISNIEYVDSLFQVLMGVIPIVATQ